MGLVVQRRRPHRLPDGPEQRLVGRQQVDDVDVKREGLKMSILGLINRGG